MTQRTLFPRVPALFFPAGFSKFVSGVLGARFSPSVLLALGLMSTALINIAFGFGTSLAWFCFFWALNGTLQARPVLVAVSKEGGEGM